MFYLFIYFYLLLGGYRGSSSQYVLNFNRIIRV